MTAPNKQTQAGETQNEREIGGSRCSLLREVIEEDLPIFFRHQLDPEANHLAAFTTKDPANRELFMAHWRMLLTRESVIVRTITVEGRVIGNIFSYESDGHLEVSSWLGREYWGSGYATRALSGFLARVCQHRPLYARSAKDNLRSVRVLEKCGFTIIGEGRGFGNGRGSEVEEYLFVLH